MSIADAHMVGPPGVADSSSVGAARSKPTPSRQAPRAISASHRDSHLAGEGLSTKVIGASRRDLSGRDAGPGTCSRGAAA